MGSEWNFIGTGKTRESIISALKADDLPVVIYGTGKFGKAVAEYVIKNNISILCFLDKEEYWYSGKTITIGGNAIQCFTKTLALYKKESYNLLLGMIDFSLLSGLKEEFADCHYVEYLDVYSTHIMSKSFLIQNREKIRKIYGVLSDEESRKVLEAYLYARYTGDVEILSRLVHDVEYLYDWDLLALSKDDIVIDGGAYTGDTILEMKKYLGDLPSKVFAFEPDKENAEKIMLYFSDREVEHISIINAGLYCRDDIMLFSASGTLGSKISEKAADMVVTQALDMHREYCNATILKMDIEGSELEALKGAEILLRENHPRLAICIYHNNYDLIAIHEYLMQFGYHFYLRQHSASVEETVLYAI